MVALERGATLVADNKGGLYAGNDESDHIVRCALDDLVEWLGFEDVQDYLDALFFEEEAIFAWAIY